MARGLPSRGCRSERSAGISPNWAYPLDGQALFRDGACGGPLIVQEDAKARDGSYHDPDAGEEPKVEAIHPASSLIDCRHQLLVVIVLVAKKAVLGDMGR
jgi:hypothetical protein